MTSLGEHPAGRALALVGRHLREGLPAVFVCALAAAVLVAILYTVATKKPKEQRGYAELTLTRGGCVIDPARHFNAIFCERIGPGAYRVTFDESLEGSTVVASRGSCCPGPIRASVDSDRSAIVVVSRRVRAPIRATVLAP